MMLTQATLLVGVVLVGVSLGGVAGQDWTVKAMFRTTVNLTCTDSRVNMTEVDQALRIRWILPSGEVMDTTMDDDRIKLHDKGKILQILALDEVDFGVYYCLITHNDNEKSRVVKKGVNINGPYWGDLLQFYRINIIVGSVAAAVVAIIMLACCFLYDRNAKQGVYIDEEEFELALHKTKHKHPHHGGHVNSAMKSDEGKTATADVEMKERPSGNGALPDNDLEPTTHL